MLSAPSQSNQRAPRRFLIALDTVEQAQAVQTFLWCLWLAAMSHSRPVSTGTVAAARLSPSFGYDSAGYAPASTTRDNRLCGIAVANAATCSGGTGAIVYDGNGNILSYTRPTAAQSSNTPGADGALLQLNGYTAFNLPTSITKTLSGSVTASSEFFYDAGYQRVRRIKRGPAGAFADDILYVPPGGFEVHRNDAGQITQSIATVSGPDGGGATVSTSFDSITGQSVIASAQTANTTHLSGTSTITKILLKDHLKEYHFESDATEEEVRLVDALEGKRCNHN